jgi:RNA polymerase sigma factor (sigma-70 family)
MTLAFAKPRPMRLDAPRNLHSPSPASRALSGLFQAYRGRILVTYVLVAAENLFLLAQPYCLGWAISGLLAGSAAGLAALAAQHLGAMAFATARRMYDTRAFTAIYNDLASRIVPEQRRRAVEISRVAARSTLSRELVDFFERDVSVGLNALFAIAGALVMLTIYDRALTLFCLVLVGPSAMLNRAYGRRAARLNGRLNDELEREVGVIERGETDEVRAHFARIAAWRVKLSDSQALNGAAMESIVLIVLAASLLRASAGTASGNVGQVVAVFRYVLMFVMGLDGVPVLVQQFGRLHDISRRLQVEECTSDCAPGAHVATRRASAVAAPESAHAARRGSHAHHLSVTVTWPGTYARRLCPPVMLMSSSDSQAAEIEQWIERLKAGDRASRDALLACASERLERLTRKMLKDFPGVHRWEETDDILQNAALRLCRALDAVTPATARDFFRLAAAQIRRELIDMARRYSGPMGLGAHHASVGGDSQNADALGGMAADQTHDPAGLAEWTSFHREVENLPETLREVFDLLFYQGLSQAEAAQVLNVSERTVKRHWQSARLSLHAALGGALPNT